MILEIDYGNTRLKWRLLDAESLECIARGAVVGLQELQLSLQKAGCLELVFCRACSVRAVDENARLSMLIENSYGVVVEYAQSFNTTAGVVNGYIEPSKLGADRWLAIVAAYTKVRQACVVIDCGTAVTVDYIRSDGRHIGGCIAPGFKMLLAMLQENTQLSVEVATAVHNEKMLLGDNTQAAVSAGVRSMFRGFLSEQLKLGQALLGSSFSVLCTGGDRALVCDVADDAVLEEDLVFTGLAIVCPHVAKE